MTRRAWRRRTIVLSLFLAAALFLWAFVLEPASIGTKEYAIAIPNWPKACSGLRVAVLADLHVGSPFNGLSKLERIIRLTQNARPDIVLLAGDFVIHVLGGHFVDPVEIAARLRNISPKIGMYAVLGNHDRKLGVNRLREAFTAADIPLLEDTAEKTGSGACSFWIGGVSDFLKGAHDVRAALSAVPENSPVILFTHNPDVFPEIPDRVSLTIAGHTHGGQVYIPGIGRPIVPSRFGQRFALGHIIEQNRHLFVTPGLGTSIIPVRFLVPPEISILTLNAI